MTRPSGSAVIDGWLAANRGSWSPGGGRSIPTRVVAAGGGHHGSGDGRAVRALGLKPRRLPLGTGAVCDLGLESDTRIALRADMDALPITGTHRSAVQFHSSTPSPMRAGATRTAMLLATGALLAGVDDLPVGCG